MRRQRLSNRACVGLIAVLALPVWLRAAARAPIADAAERRDAIAIHALLKQGADVSAAQPDGMTALHWAALHGDRELASMLLFAGANVRATTRLGAYTALHLASRAGNAALINTLLDGGADAKARTSTGATALMLAAETGRADAVKLLLDRGADTNAKESTYGQTALMFAAALDRAEVVALLAARGADPNIASAFTDLKALALPEPPTAGQSARLPAEAPAETTKPADAKAPKPPDVPGITRPFRYNELIGAQGGLTPLHFAARQGGLASARALVDAGANVNAPSPADRTTPLLVATINGQFDLALYLLDHGANPNLASDAGATPLYAAVNVQWAPKAAYPQPRAHLQQQCSYLDLMRALLGHGADPNVRINRKIWYSSYNFDQSNVDEAGATAFWRAAYAADVDAMRLLASAGADSRLPTVKAPERRDPDSPDGGVDISGLPALPNGGPNMSALLAAAGPGYSKGFAGNSHHVAPGGMLAAVKYLVEECHADVNDTDAEGNTAVHNAASRGDNEMILYLVSKGANVRAVNRHGQTTVDVANGPVQRVQPFPETIALLEKLGAKNNHKCVSC
ncbi:MAG TPA: ankyrin repeat domain-containing protein [Vicinamibacterales bacterium]